VIVHDEWIETKLLQNFRIAPETGHRCLLFVGTAGGILARFVEMTTRFLAPASISR